MKMASVPLEQEISWSRDAARHKALLRELTELRRAIVDAVDELGVLENTLIFYMSDNGHSTEYYEAWGRQYGGQYCVGEHCSPLFPDYFAMQDALRDAYRTISLELGAMLAHGVGVRRYRASVRGVVPVEAKAEITASEQAPDKIAVDVAFQFVHELLPGCRQIQSVDIFEYIPVMTGLAVLALLAEERLELRHVGQGRRKCRKGLVRQAALRVGERERFLGLENPCVDAVQLVPVERVVGWWPCHSGDLRR